MEYVSMLFFQLHHLFPRSLEDNQAKQWSYIRCPCVTVSRVAQHCEKTMALHLLEGRHKASSGEIHTQRFLIRRDHLAYQSAYVAQGLLWLSSICISDCASWIAAWIFPKVKGQCCGMDAVGGRSVALGWKHRFFFIIEMSHMWVFAMSKIRQILT